MEMSTAEIMSDRQREDYEVSVIIGASDRMLRKEDRSLGKRVNMRVVKGPIFSTCNNPKCRTVNNLTKNKSTFCSECGTLLTDRHY